MSPQPQAPAKIPPLRLRRAYLFGVGPEGARFDPLDLDLRAADGSAASRVLLSLTNTGGKSTLITLLSSLVVPAANAQIAGKNLGDYVLTGDTSHIVCEWDDDTTGSRTVTGTVMQWKERTQPSKGHRNLGDLNRFWYLFRTGGSRPAIDDLPFVDGERRRNPLSVFRSLCDDLFAAHADAQWVKATTQSEWSELLATRTALDPILFGFQMRMNDSEAGAQKLIEDFRSPSHVVRFFVGALNDDARMGLYTDKLAKYAATAANRPAVEALAGFCDAAVPALETVAATASDLDDAHSQLVQARTAGGALVSQLHARVVVDSEMLRQRRAERDAFASELEEITRAAGRISDIRNQLLLDAARSRLAAADAALEQARRRENDTTGERAAWDAVPIVLDVERTDAERRTAKLALESANEGLAPLRSQVRTAWSHVAAHLDALIASATTASTRTADDVEEAKKDRTAARAAHRERSAAVTAISDQAAKLEADIDAFAAARDAAIEAGWCAPGETAAGALTRWQATLDQRTDATVTARTTAETARRDADAVADEGPRLTAAHKDAERALSDAGDALSSFDAAAADLASFDVVVELAAGDVTTSAAASRVAGTARAEAAAADQRMLAHQQSAAAATAELAHLDSAGTASGSADVAVVRAALDAAGVGAVAGLEWIEHNVADATVREQVISTAPDLAGGVIVLDRGRLDDASSAVADVVTRSPVAVRPVPHDLDGIADTAGFVVIPHRATWDREWAKRWRETQQHVADTESAAAIASGERANELRAAAAALDDFARRFAGVERDSLAAAVDEATKARAAALDALTGHDQRLRAARAAAKATTKAVEEATKAVADAERRVRDATGLAALAVDDPEGRRQQLRAARAVALAAEADAAQEIVRLDELVSDLERRHHALERDLADWRRQRGTITDVDEATVPAGANLDQLDRAARQLEQTLAAAEAGLVEAARYRRAEADWAEASKRLSAVAEATIERARTLAGSLEASSAEGLAAAQRRAHRAAEDAVSRRLEAENEHGNARQALAEQEPSDRLNYFDLAAAAEWIPADGETHTEVLARLDVRREDLRRKVRAGEEHAAAIDSAIRDIDAAIAAFTEVIELWRGEPVPAPDPFTGSPADARAAMRRSHDDLDAANELVADATGALRDAQTAARAIARAPQWAGLTTQLIARVTNLTDEALAAQAEMLAHEARKVGVNAAAEVAELDDHRDVLRGELVLMCAEQRRMLREVVSSSRLPDGLGELTGQPAVKIHFTDATADVAAGRLNDRIESWASEIAADPKRAGTATTRVRWLADAVADTVVERARAGAFSVEILKPTLDGRALYCTPDRISAEYSGGQVLTLAVLVYCTLSKVRAAHRVGGSRPPGTLILDNPFGAASAEALISMQHRLAAQSGLQLVCATGLNDAAVEAAFAGSRSVIVKLRNDTDVRRNLAFLRVRDRTAGLGDVLGSDLRPVVGAEENRGHVDATTYQVLR